MKNINQLFAIIGSRPLVLALLLSLVLLPRTSVATPGPSTTKNKAPQKTIMKRVYAVVLARPVSAAAAEPLLAQASEQLGLMNMGPTFEGGMVCGGTVLALQRLPGIGLVVTAHLDNQPASAAQVRDEVRHYFPLATVVQASVEEQHLDIERFAAYMRADLIVLASNRSYPRALRAAREAATKAKIPYSSRGLIYDRKLGLIFSGIPKDDAWNGQYFPRREEECGKLPTCISVERGDGYPGLPTKEFVVVAGFLDPEDKGKLLRLKQHLPTARVVRTTLYLGCIH